jgi:hypothetical protein
VLAALRDAVDLELLAAAVLAALRDAVDLELLAAASRWY